MPTIQPLTTADYAAWLPLWHGYLTFYRTDLPAAVTLSSFQRMTAPEGPTFGALAIHNGSAVGLVHWIFHRSNWSIADNCYLQDLYVNESSRGLGIGRLLIEHVYLQAALAGANKVHWLTHESNLTAQHLYNRIANRPGFIEYEKFL